MTKWILSISLFSLFLIHSSVGQTLDRTSLDALMDHIEKNEKGMGTLSIFHKGQEIYNRSIGVHDLESKVKNDKNSLYRVGSLSKSYTATIIMQLIEERKLDIYTPIDKFFPELPGSETIVVEFLLRHTSGIADIAGTSGYEDWRTTAVPRDTMMQKIIAAGTDFEAGAQFAYTNTNYILLTYIAEMIEGKPFADIFKERIVDRIGLEHTWYPDFPESDSADQTSSYFPVRQGVWEEAVPTNPTVSLGAGAVIASASDLNRFFLALFGEKLCLESSLNTMNDLRDGKGMGMFRMPFYTNYGYAHTGSIDGYQSISVYFKDLDIAVSYIGNGVVYPVNAILVGALSYLLDKPFELPEFYPTVVLSADELDAFTGVYGLEGNPLQFTITREEESLLAQATGQSPLLLDVIGKTAFQFQPIGLKLDFILEQNQMRVRQGGHDFIMTKGLIFEVPDGADQTRDKKGH